MTKEELKKILNGRHINSWNKLYKDSPEIQGFLFSLYGETPNTDKEIFELFYLIMHDMDEKPKSYCGKNAFFKKYGKGYVSYCNDYDRTLKEKSCSVCHVRIYEERNKKIKTTNLEKYGTEISQQSDIVKQKVINTNLERYGVESHNSVQEIKDKKVESYLERYGVENPSQIDGIQEKISKNYKTKTGVSHPLKHPNIRSQIKKTCNTIYGGNSPTSSHVVIKKQKETNIERYGTDSYSYTSEYHNRVKNTIINKGEKYKEDLYKSIKLKNLKGRMKSASRNSDLIPLFEYDDLYGKLHTDLFPYMCLYCDNLVYSSYSSFKKCTCQKQSGISNAEKELLEYIKSLLPEGTEIIENCRSIISPKEIDIYIPSLKIGFEYNGMYWHSTEFIDKKQHQQKVILCKEKDIKLIHIFEDEWGTKRELICSRIKSALSVSNKIYARKCAIREISKNAANSFIDAHHIQGSTNALINIGLYYDNELIAVMNFSKSRFDKNVEYELIRYCSNNTVVGGASKLLKYFEREYKPESLLTYADMNWSNGNLYETIGFDYVSTTDPGYFYYNPQTKERISRQRCQKHKLVKQGYDSNLTETEICCNILGYYKIYDSGNLKFLKKY